MTALPYNLKPKATVPTAGTDPTLRPPAPLLNPLLQAAAAAKTQKVDTSPGPTGTPDVVRSASTDPAVRSVPASTWPSDVVLPVPNAPKAETISPQPALDPDIAMWPEVPISIWPFTGSPTTGRWPKGWLGIDNTATLYVCTVAGAPGTWEAIGGGGGGISEFQFTPGNGFVGSVGDSTGPTASLSLLLRSPVPVQDSSTGHLTQFFWVNALSECVGSQVNDLAYLYSTGVLYQCTVAGSPGTWAVFVSASGGLTSFQGRTTAAAVLLAADVTGLGSLAIYSNVPSNPQTSDYTVQASDVGKSIDVNTSSPVNITIPNGVIAATSTFEIYQEGTGLVTIVEGAGVTITPPPGLTLVSNGQGSTMALRALSSTVFALAGDLNPS